MINFVFINFKEEAILIAYKNISVPLLQIVLYYKN